MGKERRERIKQLHAQLVPMLDELVVLRDAEQAELERKMLTAVQASSLLKCSISTVYDLAECGRLSLPISVYGGPSLFYIKEVQRLAACKYDWQRYDIYVRRNKLHLTREDVYIPSFWWRQAQKIKEQIGKGITKCLISTVR